MNILLFSQMGRTRGGGETVFECVASGLEKREYKIDRVYLNSKLKVGSCKYTGDGYDIHLSIPPQLRTFLRPTYFYKFIASIIGLSLILNKLRPDVINIHFFMAESFYFALLEKIFGYRLILSCHGSDVNDIKGMQKRIAPFVLRQSDLVTCVSEALKKKLRHQIEGNYLTKVIYNGVDYEFWKKSAVLGRYRNVTNELKLITVGSLKPVKGHDILINAVEEITNKNLNIHLEIIGDGPFRNKYEQIISNKNLTNLVTITGWLPKDIIRKKLHQSSLFIFPSRREGFGLALVEAMAAGLPIIASNTGGIPEILKDVNALLVPPEKPSDLAEAIEQAVKNEQWRISASRSSQKKALKFCWKKTLNEYESTLFQNDDNS